MCFLYIVLLLAYQSDLSLTEKLDGKKLSDKLKIIRDGIGVPYMQNVYDRLPFQPKTGDGGQLLNNIKANIEGELSRLGNIILTIQSEVLKQEQRFSTESTLPLCCEFQQSHLTYDPKFRHEVNFTTACVTKSPISASSAKYPPKELGDLMKNNYNNDKNVLWQHYGTIDGTSVIFPATKWGECSNYDPRLRAAYTSTASPKNKDVVLVIDSSSSMKDMSGVSNKKKLLLAKEAGNIVIQSLSPNDRVAVLSFNAEIGKGAGCYENTLSYATKENIPNLKEIVSLIPESSKTDKNFEKALQAAFSYLQQSDANRDKVILFVSDGMYTHGQDPREVIRDENMKIQNEAVVFTYLLKTGEDNTAATLFQEMASQPLSDGTYGIIRPGHFSSFELNNHKNLATDMASFYVHMQDDLKRSTPHFSVPYVDLYSGVGLMTSMCVPTHITSMFHGVACTDIKIGELLKDVEFFEEGNSTYAFMVDKSGRTIAHPLLPDPTYIKKNPVQVDISTLERSPGSVEILNKMKSGLTGNKTLPAVYFTIPRGTLINDGSSIHVSEATFFWAPISNTDFTVAIVLSEESHSEISESGFQMSSDDLQNCFMYHERSLKSDSHQNCRFNSRLVTLEKTSVKFAPSVFQNPFQYTDKDETTIDVINYEKYLTKQTDDNPGFKSNIRAEIWATYELEKFWKITPSNHLSWRYIGTLSGIMRVHPAVSLTKTYDHKKRPWFRQTVAHPEMMYITPPYEDAWGSGILLSLEQTLHKRGSRQVTAVLGTDFPLQYFNWYIDQIYPTCASTEYRCIIIEDNGFIVMHPSFKDSTNAEMFMKSIHITEEEPALANEMVNKGILNSHECKDFSEKKELRSYRITMPTGNEYGFDFEDTGDQFELRPIPETNIFIIRQRTSSSSTLSSNCKCDELVQPDFRQCTDCDCLCFRKLIHNVCFNNYSSEGSLPCSARLPDTSGVSTPEDLTNLPTCFNPKCSSKTSKSQCFSEAECGWCEFTVEGFELDQQCCSLKEDCSFGKTKSSAKDTCDAIPRSTVTPEEDKSQQNSSDNTNRIIIAAVAGAAGVAITIAIVVVIILLRKKNCCKNELYLDPMHDPYVIPVQDPMGSIDSGYGQPFKEFPARQNSYT